MEFSKNASKNLSAVANQIQQIYLKIGKNKLKNAEENEDFSDLIFENPAVSIAKFNSTIDYIRSVIKEDEFWVVQSKQRKFLKMKACVKQCQNQFSILSTNEAYIFVPKPLSYNCEVKYEIINKSESSVHKYRIALAQSFSVIQDMITSRNGERNSISDKDRHNFSFALNSDRINNEGFSVVEIQSNICFSCLSYKKNNDGSGAIQSDLDRAIDETRLKRFGDVAGVRRGKTNSKSKANSARSNQISLTHSFEDENEEGIVNPVNFRLPKKELSQSLKSPSFSEIASASQISNQISLSISSPKKSYNFLERQSSSNLHIQGKINSIKGDPDNNIQKKVNQSTTSRQYLTKRTFNYFEFQKNDLNLFAINVPVIINLFTNI